MKKLLAIIFVLFCEQAFSATVFSITGTTETWLTVDLEYGCFFKNPFDPDVTTDDQFGALGTGLTFLSFDNWYNWGVFLHGYVLFPGTTVSTKDGGAVVTRENINIMVAGILGPAYRILFENNSFMYFSIGFHFRYLVGSYTRMYDGESMPEDWYDMDGFNMGVGGDIGFKFQISEVFHLDFGLVWMYDIFSDMLIDDPDRVRPKYLWITAKPYLGFGTILTTDKSITFRIGN
jgi:hypothetical protein